MSLGMQLLFCLSFCVSIAPIKELYIIMYIMLSILLQIQYRLRVEHVYRTRIIIKCVLHSTCALIKGTKIMCFSMLSTCKQT